MHTVSLSTQRHFYLKMSQKIMCCAGERTVWLCQLDSSLLPWSHLTSTCNYRIDSDHSPSYAYAYHRWRLWWWVDDVTVTLATGEDDASEETVSLTLVSPSDRWFAIGFGSSTITMCNHMLSMSVQMVVSIPEGVTKRKLDYHGSGTGNSWQKCGSEIKRCC